MDHLERKIKLSNILWGHKLKIITFNEAEKLLHDLFNNNAGFVVSEKKYYNTSSHKLN